MTLKSFFTGLALTTAFASTGLAHSTTKLLRDPALSENQIAFIYAGDIWVSERNGDNTRRLTSSAAQEANPVFSPDGTMIAYTSRFENNEDVYIIPTKGGQPKRLTWHPGGDIVLDWTKEGNAIAFASQRETNHGRSSQLYHVSIDGGLPEKQMQARIFRGRYDSSGDFFAYLAFRPGYNALFGGTSGWRGYRGGSTPAIQILDMKTDNVATINGENANNIEPMWVGESIYFLSDRDDKTLNLFKFTPTSGKTVKVGDDSLWDVRAADSYDEDIIFERGGELHLFDTKTGDTEVLNIAVSPDLPQLRPQWKDASKTIQSYNISPNGKRLALTARGDVFTVPVKDGTTRNLSQSPTHDYTALWSPDGQSLAYIDAAKTTQYLVLTDQTGLKKDRRIKLDKNFNFLVDWGGDGSHIITTNNKLELKAIHVESGKIDKIAIGSRRETQEADISPDGRWVAYTQEQPNFNRDLYLYNLETKTSILMSDGMADISSPHFSPDGQYLYFAGSTNSGPQQAWLDLSSREVPYRAAIYAAVLASDGQSPLHKSLGDEDGDDEAENANDKGTDEKNGKVETRIDIDGLQGRIISLPLAQDNYSNIRIARDGTLFAIINIQAGARVTPPGEQQSQKNELIRYDFKNRKVETVLSGVTSIDISASGEHLAIQKSDNSIHVAKIADTFKPEHLKTSDMKMKVNPREEWEAIFDEAWRMERAYFYDPNMHGLDWDSIYERYHPLVQHVGRREDLTALIVEMIGEMQVGHNRSGGGDTHREASANTGLLGADLVVSNGRHRIEKIYTGENWNPFISSPLSGPGIDINEGDYILSINGHDLEADDNIFEYLQDQKGKLVTLSVANQPNGRNARDVVVEPTSSESGARLWNWVESNRKQVDEATDGRVGYVFLPNTAGAGFTLFNRMFFSQVDKEAIIFDERSNGGGNAANYITDVLSRKYLAGWKDSVGLEFRTPGGAMFGPKVMLMDQDAGSGGDFLPYSFREHELGPLIGTRTWGGLIGISANPPLIDGGYLSVPNFRFFDVNYEWTVENEGVEPDIEVPLDPVLTNKGRDSQLERAISEIMEALENFEPEVPDKAPTYPTEVGK